jgi:hypothetical protein
MFFQAGSLIVFSARTNTVLIPARCPPSTSVNGRSPTTTTSSAAILGSQEICESPTGAALQPSRMAGNIE